MGKWSKALRGAGEGVASVGKTLLDDALLRRRDEMLAKLRAQEQAVTEAGADRRLGAELDARAKQGKLDRESAERIAGMRTDNTTAVKVDDITTIHYNKTIDPNSGETTIGEPAYVEILNPADGSRDVFTWQEYRTGKDALAREKAGKGGAAAPPPDTKQTPAAPVRPPLRPQMNPGASHESLSPSAGYNTNMMKDWAEYSGLMSAAPGGMTVAGKKRYVPPAA